MTANTYRVSKRGGRTVIHKQNDGKGDFVEVKSINVVMGEDDMMRLQQAFDQAAKDEAEKATAEDSD